MRVSFFGTGAFFHQNLTRVMTIFTMTWQNTFVMRECVGKMKKKEECADCNFLPKWPHPLVHLLSAWSSSLSSNSFWDVLREWVEMRLVFLRRIPCLFACFQEWNDGSDDEDDNIVATIDHDADLIIIKCTKASSMQYASHLSLLLLLLLLVGGVMV